MKKTIIPAMLLLLSVSAFAVDTNINDYIDGKYIVGIRRGAGSVSDELTEAIVGGEKLGKCDIIRSMLVEIPSTGEEMYMLQVQNGSKHFGITLREDSRIAVFSKNGAAIYNADAEDNGDGKIKYVNFRLIVSKDSTDLIVQTKTANKAGVLQVVKNGSFRCTSK